MDYSIITDMPENDYHALDYISASKLKLVAQSPSHYAHAKDFKTTPDMEMGTAFHSEILEPDKKGVIHTKSKTIDKKHKEVVAEFPDKIVLTLPRWELLEKMVSRFKVTKIHDRMMTDKGESEITIVGSLDEIKVKCRIDRVKYLPTQNQIILYDLKTIAKMPKDPRGFLYAVLDWGYHIQAAWYVDMCKAAGFIPRKFYFIFQEKVAPFNSYQVHLSEDLLDYGRQQAYAAFDTYKECLRTNLWPSPYEMSGIGSLCIDKPDWITSE